MKAIIIAPLLSLLLVISSSSLFAEEQCVFDKTAYINFINEYKTRHPELVIEKQKNTLRLKRNNETIEVNGGGCVHPGMRIKLRSEKTFSEKQFLRKTLALSTEFGNWLINVRELENSINKGLYQKINNTYFIQVDAITVFEGFFDMGEINISFYIN